MRVIQGSCLFDGIFFIFSIPGLLDRSSFRSCFSIALALATYYPVDCSSSSFPASYVQRRTSTRIGWISTPVPPAGVDMVRPLSISSFGHPPRLHFMMNVRHTELETRLRSSV